MIFLFAWKQKPLLSYQSTNNNYSIISDTYYANVRPGLQVFNGLCGQVLFVKLSVHLRQFGHPEAITVLRQDLSDVTLDQLGVVGLCFPRTKALI